VWPPALRRLLERLDTAPGQEKALRAIIDDLRTRMKAAKSTDGADVLKTFHSELTQAYERALETLDDKQRKLLADLIASRF
jgi:small-conductance mechanosensitive channel